MTCPLCAEDPAPLFHTGRLGRYFQCPRCLLVHLDPAQRLSLTAEKNQYLRHDNDPADVGYRRFLDRMASPLAARLRPHSRGLDFGCGPGPTLSVMLEEWGHTVSLYDPFFYPDRSTMTGPFDFITATEVAEHLYQPGLVLDDLFGRLKPGAWLGLMTKRVTDRAAFETWHYKSDPTHVCFFHVETMRWLAHRWAARIEVISADVVLFQRSE